MIVKKLKKNLFEYVFKIICLLSIIIPLLILLFLITDTFIMAKNKLNLSFLTSFPSRNFDKAGILPSLLGTIYLMFLTTIISIPLGVCSAIYLEEYCKNNLFKKIIEINIGNLAGLPSVIFGLLGLEIFVRFFNLGPSLIAAALTLSLLILPVIIIASRESLKMVPLNLKEAAISLGASKLSIIWHIILPLSISQMITGIILALSRAIGESAPLIILGAAAYIAFIPSNIMSEFSSLPLQIFQWVQKPQTVFLQNASAAIIVLLIILFFMNALATLFRFKNEKKY
jgi:phosphate transport system permease protein